MIFQNDDDLYRPRRRPWGTILLSAFCVALALAVVFAIRTRMKRAEARQDDGAVPASVQIPAAAPISVAPNPSVSQAPVPMPTPPPVTQPARLSPPPSPPPRPSLAAGVPPEGLLTEQRDLKARLAAAAPAERAAIETALGDVNVRIATTAVPAPNKVIHTIVSGDSLGKIASKYVCPVSLIRKINNLKDNNIRIGNTLYVLDHPQFAIEVSKSHNTLLVTLGGEFFKRYSVCTGANGSTPTGTFKITEKDENPTWYPKGRAPVPFGDPANILGTRWMRIEATGDTPRATGYGIHGTWDDASIGTAASDGCIRMHNADVEELFALLPLNPAVPVTIVE